MNHVRVKWRMDLFANAQVFGERTVSTQEAHRALETHVLSNPKLALLPSGTFWILCSALDSLLMKDTSSLLRVLAQTLAPESESNDKPKAKKSDE